MYTKQRIRNKQTQRIIKNNERAKQEAEKKRNKQNQRTEMGFLFKLHCYSDG